MKNPKALKILYPLVLGLAGSAHAGWSPLETFETGFTVGNPINGLNGWVVDISANAIAAADPAASGRGTVARVNPNATRNDIYKALGASQIANGTTGTVFFEVFLPAPAAASNTSIGASDMAAPNDFASLEPQFRFLNSDISPRNAGVFVDTGFDFDSGEWIKVWLVVNNTSDTVDMHVRAPSGSTSRVLVADNFGFRNGTAANAMLTFVFIQGAGAASQTVYFDNIHVDTAGENLNDPTIVDTDGDSMDDNWEIANFGSKEARDGTLDFDTDNFLDLQEYETGTDPNDQDSDDDGLFDGNEANGSSNLFNGLATDPADSDSDNDGANDGQENGSLNTEFGNAPTNPKVADTDADGMSDGYELTCNSAGTALNPNDDGTTDPNQAPTGDRDGDTKTNIAEFTGPPQTRADKVDTDSDGYNDNVEDGLGTWGGIAFTGTNPANPDSDGDGIPDGSENRDLESFPGTGIYPTNSDPNLADTDLDQFPDKYEVDHGSNPNDFEDNPAQTTGFTLVEDFEGAGMTIGQSFNGVNGWTTTVPAGALVADEPIEGGDKVGSLVRVLSPTASFTLSKRLDMMGLQVLEGNTGTIFLQVHCSTPSHDNSLGFSDQASPAAGDFNAFEAQVVTFAGSVLRVRDAALFRDPPGQSYRVGQWMNVWIVADNATDTFKVYVESPANQTGQIEITNDGGVDPFNFRNGTGTALNSVLMAVADGAEDGSTLYIDNIHVDPGAANLATPAAAKPLPSVDPIVTEVSRNGGGDLVIKFSPGGAGYILTSSNDLASPFVPETNAIYDNIDTFTVPAAFLNPGRDFFRVENP
jgi:hypothetical protein